MKWHCVSKYAAVTLACLICFHTITFAASTFKDVPSAHWAYGSISSIAERGLMVGDTTGYFKPMDLIDKFDTMRIIARAIGYKYTDVSEAEQTYYNRAYEKNKSVLAGYAKAFSKWRSTADREIAFLVEKEILTLDDLKQFVIKDANDAEKLRALSREEAAVFLVRLLGKKDAALAEGAASAPFKDDGAISAGNKPYVYYLRSRGIVAGDPEGNFNPNGGVTRAEMAVLLDKSLAAQSEGIAGQTSFNDTNVSTINNVSGTFDKYYPQLGAVQIMLQDGKKKIYKLSANATIYIDSYLKTCDDLKEGMPLTAVVANDTELLDIKAQSNIVSAATTTPAPEAAVQNYSYAVEGIVNAFTSGAVGKNIDVEIRMLNPRGEIITEIHKYSVPDTTPVTRGNDATSIDTIIKGDVVRIEYTGNTATKIQIEQKNRSFTNVTLAEKKYVEATSTPILVLQDANGKTYDLCVTNTSVLTRRGLGDVTWKDIRVGDLIDATAEYDKLLTLNASGTYSNIEGVIQEIHLTKNSSSIVLLNDTTKKNEMYGLIADKLDVYTLRLGSRVKLRLDSKEVESVLSSNASGITAGTNNNTNNNSVTGYIQSVSKNLIVLRDTTGGAAGQKEVKLDVNTIAVNANTGSRVDPAALSAGLKIYVVLTPGSNVAQTISILTE